MLTKELTNRLEELRYSWNTYNYENSTYIEIYNPYVEEYYDEEIATVCVNKPYIFDTNTYLFEQMDEEHQKELHELLSKYSSTPEDEREDQNQKHTYKHKYLKTKHGKDAYLAISMLANNRKYYSELVDEVKNTENYQVLFTNTEIEKYSKGLDIDLNNYIKEEAEDVRK